MFNQFIPCFKERPPFCFSNNSVRHQPISVAIGMQHPERTCCKCL